MCYNFLMTEIALSNATTFFTGRLEAVFRKAKKHGLKYLEILPYRWTVPEQVLALQKKYGIEVAGLHLPQWWQKTYGQLCRERRGLLEKIINLVLQFYLGNAAQSPAWKILAALRPRRPYVLFHGDLVSQIEPTKFAALQKEHHAVIENVMPSPTAPRRHWDPREIKKIAPVVLDPAHFGALRPDLPEISSQVRPEIIHIGYEHGFPFYHDLPNAAEQAVLRQILRLSPPRFLVLETYPWVSAKKGIKLLRKIISE